MRVEEAKSIRRLAVCTLLSVSLLASAVSAQETLRWKFTKGEQLKYNRRQERVMRGTVGQQPLNQSVERVTDVTLVVDAVEDGGSARITETIDRVRFKQTTPAGTVDFDSDNPPSGDGAKLASSLQPLAGLKFSFQMTPRGEVKGLQLSEASKKRLAEHPSVLPAGKEADLLRQLVPAMLLPEAETVSAGTTWREVTELTEPRVGKRKVTATYEYTGSHPQGERWLADITIRSTAELEPAPDAPAKIEVVNEAITGTVHFDPRSGLLVERSEKDATKTRITVQAQTFDQEAENVVSFKLVQEGTGGGEDGLHE